MAIKRTLIAIMYDPNMYQRGTELKGFVHRPIKEMTVRWAPSYSGKGPFKDRTFRYVELKNKDGKNERWSFQMGEFGNRNTDEIQQIPMVTLSRSHRIPDDLFELPQWVKLY